MRWEDVFFDSGAIWLPAVVPAERAVADGLVEAEVVRRAQVTGVTVSEHGQSPPEMAVAAAQIAVARSSFPEISLILHASSYYQGHDMWAPASYVQHHAVGNHCPAIEIRQTSNGGMASVELAAAHLVGAGGTAALLTTADRFSFPGIDRWRSDEGTVLADGATAVVLTRGSGFAKLQSLVMLSEPALERMHRGADPFSLAPLSVRCPLNMGETTSAFLRSPEGQRSVVLMASRQREVVSRALDEAEVTLSEVDWFVLPHFGRRRLDVNFFRRLGIDPARTLWTWSRGIGHLGAGDQFAGLTWLVETGAVRPGDRCLLLGVGGGFTWSAAVLEIVETPAWGL